MNGSIHPIYFPAAVLLGALHAMEPGHAKALTASYLIGIKGTKRDSVILGLSVATTHSIVVILISAIGIWLGNEAFTGKATQWLETGSGLVAVAIGCWMLWRRLFVKRKSEHHDHPHRQHAPKSAITLETLLQGKSLENLSFSLKAPKGHAHLDDEAHARAHAATLPDYAKNGERPSLGQIIMFGAAGGMIPCPASITVMLLALSTGSAGLGVLTVLGFSLGLAVALVGIGMIIVSGLSKLSETGRLSWATRKAPVVSAALVIASGLFALLIAHKG